jgi:hypothetical protein
MQFQFSEDVKIKDKIAVGNRCFRALNKMLNKNL